MGIPLSRNLGWCVDDRSGPRSSVDLEARSGRAHRSPVLASVRRVGREELPGEEEAEGRDEGPQDNPHGRKLAGASRLKLGSPAVQARWHVFHHLLMHRHEPRDPADMVSHPLGERLRCEAGQRGEVAFDCDQPSRQLQPTVV